MDASSAPEASLDELIAAAKRVAGSAWCPYSRFAVGAALLTSSGKVVAGCNVENASSGLTICAERNAAVFQAIAAGERSFRHCCLHSYAEPTSSSAEPAGRCLLSLPPTLPILCVCDGPGRLETSSASLLPHAFGPESINPAGQFRRFEA